VPSISALRIFDRDFARILEEISDVRRNCRYLPLLFLLLFCIQFANAQSGFDVNVGFGAAQDKSLGSVDLGTLLPCSSAGSANCANTPSLNGFMIGVGANLMLWKHFGVGGEVKLQPKKQDYLIFQKPGVGVTGDKLLTRVTFYDFNGIFQPVNQKKVALQLVGGVGAANVKFYENQSSSGSVLGNANVTQFIQSANHFQVHGGAGVQIYLTDHVFIRPQFDVHYVRNFTHQYGRNTVTSEMIWLGYSFGDRP
jgi:hypothetical protein